MEYTCKINGEAADVTLSGSINEQSGEVLTRIRQTIDAVKKVRFDCAKVDAINSTGLGLWKVFLRSLKKGTDYEYHRCSVYFIDYANMSPVLVEGARVVSFYAPYVCTSCNTSVQKLYETSAVKKTGKLDDISCQKCASPCRLEVEGEHFLEFMDL